MAAKFSTTSRNFRAFLRWMKEQGIEYTDGLAFEVGGSGSVADIGVRAVYAMEANDLIATIPKAACITVKNTAVGELIEGKNLRGELGLAVALMYELSLEERSKWFVYLQFIPRRQMLPFLWSPSDVDSFLQGTELHKVIQEDRILMEEEWKQSIAPLTVDHANEFLEEWFTFDRYLTAKSLVSSRAFEVDEYHGYGMVPLADLFNHKTAAEDVHFTTVFSESGSDSDLSPDSKNSSEVLEGKEKVQTGKKGKRLNEEGNKKACHHEDEEVSDASPSAWEGNSSLLEMILVKDVSEDSEIFNTYGTLSNAALLDRYGFTEPDNPFDIVNLDLTLVLDTCIQSFSARHVRRRTAQWRKIGGEPCHSRGCEYFEISFLGKPQSDLLMLLFFVHLSDEVFDKVSPRKDLNDQGIEGTARALGWERSTKGKPVPRVKKRIRQSNIVKGDTGNIDMESWLMTGPVCRSMLEILKQRDALYSTSSLADDLELLSKNSCEDQPQQFHAIQLRIRERSILKKCETHVLERLANLGNKPSNIKGEEK